MTGWFYALFCLKWKAHQSVVGVGINLFASGITAVMLKAIWQTEGMSESVPSISNLTIPSLSGIPVIGALFKDQSPYLYAMFLIVAAVWIVFYKTKFGFYCRCIGGNEEASIASGINVVKSKYMAFLINGVLVGIAGVLFMARVNAGLPNGAVGYEMEGLTAAIVGGTSFSGGVGTTSGSLIGSFIIGCLNNIMNLQGVDSYIQQVVKGIIIVAAVLYDINFKNKKSPKVILQKKDEKKEPVAKA